jgi:hypothetical protein
LLAHAGSAFELKRIPQKLLTLCLIHDRLSWCPVREEQTGWGRQQKGQGKLPALSVAEQGILHARCMSLGFLMLHQRKE